MKKFDLKNIDFQKSSEALRKTVDKVGEARKNFVETAKENAQILSDKTQAMAYDARMKKYNPLFAEQYNDDGFDCPNLIMIVNAKVRDGIDVCEGAIGWLSSENDVDVLHLYLENVEFSGLEFMPNPACDTAYYIDPHNNKRFISIDTYFSNMQEEKLAELQQIAYALGAKQYWVEVSESSIENNYAQKSASLKMDKYINGSSGSEFEKKLASHSTSIAEATWENTRIPTEPKLCWFANDNNIKNLIKMRCYPEDECGMTTYNIELNNSNAATMSTNKAAKIDSAVVKMGMKCNFNSKSVKEHSRKMVFKLEF